MASANLSLPSRDGRDTGTPAAVPRPAAGPRRSPPQEYAERIQVIRHRAASLFVKPLFLGNS